MMEKQKRKPLDMLHGSIWNKLPLFALPVAATAILEQLFNASDIAVVGNFTGTGKTIAVAAVGANSSIISLIVNLFVGIALGANVVIANAIGRKDKDAVTKSVHKVLILCIVEDAVATACAIVLILLAGRELLSIFNNDPEVISAGYTRMIMVFSAYTFSMLYENMSGYMRGFGFSLIPAIVTTLGICGVRIFWIMAVFPSHKTFAGILTAYPVSLSVTALLIFIVLLIYHPSKRFQTDKGEM